MWAGRRRENRRGRRWRKLERTGRKEGEGKGRKPEETEEEAEENVTEPATGKTQPRQSTIPRRYARKGKRDWNWKRRGERSGETGRKEGDETEGNTNERGRRDPWRKLYRTVEKNGENSQERKRRTRRGRRPPWREKMSEVRNHGARRRNPSGSRGVYPGKPGP